MIDVGSALLSLFLLAWAFAAHPTRVACPAGWWSPEGARHGVLACRPRPVGPDDRGPHGELVDRSVEPPGELRVGIYCTNGLEVRQDGVSAWCARP